MYIIVVILGVAILAGYFLRWNFRHAWYLLLIGDEQADWEKLGADDCIAPWEKKGFERRKAAKRVRRRRMLSRDNTAKQFDVAGAHGRFRVRQSRRGCRCAS
jgi:hypothetical protein